MATNSVGVPVGTPQFCVPGCGNEKYLMGAWDTLVRATVEQEAVPHVADWEFADDLSSITWKIREGIQFHQGYGELTAEDVAFSLNTTNAATNPDSIHDNAGDFSGNYGETEVVDTYTARTEITNYDSRAPLFLFSDFWQGIAISSKAVFDEHGAEDMREIFIGTGPFEVVEWRQNDQIELKGVADHWHKSPSVETATLVEAPEPSIRRAMFESGEAQLTRVELSDLPKVEEAYPTGRRTVMNQQEFISLGAGNYLETTNVKNGESLESPGFDPSLAWVGDPDAEGCDRDNLFGSATPADPPCESMENARKVREAMAITIPRADVNEALYAGSGSPSEIWDISSDDPFFKDEW
ncbi:MAG: ABC transporter substrate-binding protein, partial [Chloroflexota bacterium]